MVERQSGQYQKRVLLDTEAGERYDFLVDAGKRLLVNSALLDQSQAIQSSDLKVIEEFHRVVSPKNPEHPWRIEKAQRSIENMEIQDPSTYGNWEAPGGPLEHIQLATQAAGFIATNIDLDGVNIPRVQAAAALHDEGREVTHLFFTTEVIGRALLKKIGIREDVLSIMPTEDIMLTPLDQDMNAVIMALPPEVVIVRIADEFGKRLPGTNRLYQPEDYDSWDRQKWADSYTNRPPSGRPSDANWRKQRQLHVDNVPRYFAALDNWLQQMVGMNLKELTTQLDQEFSAQLVPLATT